MASGDFSRAQCAETDKTPAKAHRMRERCALKAGNGLELTERTHTRQEMISRLGRMAHRPSGPGRIPRRRLAGRAGLASRRLAGFRASTLATAGAGAVVVVVALAVGISQATAAPACALACPLNRPRAFERALATSG
jgi:hypothetical protein